jgi:hypothetical protein
MAVIGVRGAQAYVVVPRAQAQNSWTTAVLLAEDAGGHLVTLSGAAEDAFVRGLAGAEIGNYWIGLSDQAA